MSSLPPLPVRSSLRRSPHLLALSLAVALAACGGAGADADSLLAEEGAVPESAAVAMASPGATTEEVGEAELELYERGLAAEIEVLREAVARMASARTGEDTLSAIMAATEMQSVPEAAQRAGVDVERYRRLEGVFGPALSGRMMNPAMRGMTAQMDTSTLAELPAEEQARVRESMAQMNAAFSDSAAYRTVPPALHAAFKARAEQRLDALWKERFELRARAAGLGG